MALAEVVVCAVGRVVTLPAVEITAQATALLVLVMLSGGQWLGIPFVFRSSGARGQPAEPRPPAAAETVSFTYSVREEGIAGRGVDWDILKAGGKS